MEILYVSLFIIIILFVFFLFKYQKTKETKYSIVTKDSKLIISGSKVFIQDFLDKNAHQEGGEYVLKEEVGGVPIGTKLCIVELLEADDNAWE